MEFATAGLFVLALLRIHTIFELLLSWAILGILVIVTVYDIRHTIIPNKYVYSFLVLALLTHLPYLVKYATGDELQYMLIVLISGVVSALPFALLWLISRGRWVGLGDAKLLVGIGFIVGIGGAVVTVAIASILGSIVGLTGILFYKYKKKRLSIVDGEGEVTLKSEIPFGPFLIFGFILVWLLNFDQVYWALFGL